MKSRTPTKLRKFARGKPCTLRLRCCSHDPEQTVLCHLPHPMKGMGTKGPDEFAILACAPCHDRLDGRAISDLDGIDLWREVLRALAETQMMMKQEGLLRVAA